MDKDNRKIQNKANYLWTKVLTLQNRLLTLKCIFIKGEKYIQIKKTLI